MNVAEQFERVLGDVNHRVLPLHHARVDARAQNANGRPALLVYVGKDFSRQVDSTNGLVVRVDPPDINGDRWLRFESETTGLTPMFAGIVTTMLDGVARAAVEEDPVFALLEQYEELIRMFARRSGRLGESALRGLFAELSMLLLLRDAGIPVASAMNAWQGPYRVAKDFVLPRNRAIEVKSMRRMNRRVTISSVDQLDPFGEDLRLAVLTFERVSPGEGLPFLELLSNVRTWASSDPAAYFLFEQALSALGLDAADVYYEQWHFDVRGWRWFAVDESFPRIHPHTVPSAISKVSYSLDTDQLDDFTSQAHWEDPVRDV